MSENFKPHLFTKNVHTSQSYTTPPSGGGGTVNLPVRNRNEHGNALLHSLSQIWDAHKQEVILRTEKGLPVKDGEYLTFKSAVDNTLKIESLDSSGAVLLNVNTNKETNQQIATVFIPEDKKNKFVDKVEKYINTDDGAKPRNQELIEKIDSVEITTVEYLWSSPIEFIPHESAIWCEIWLATEGEPIDPITRHLSEVCTLFEIEFLDGVLEFPQRTIFIIKANYAQLNELIGSFGLIAEIRKTEELNSFWINQRISENNQWVDEALRITTFTKTNNFICILDTGINNGHSLIEPILDDPNLMTVEPGWGLNDSDGHGTSMAGVAAYGNLNAILENKHPIEIHHQLESVKILHPAYPNDKLKLPLITIDAVNRAIINNPGNNRIFCMAITTDFQVDFGKPSAYSSVIDKIIFGEDNDDKKLFVISAGNVRYEDDYKNYPESNLNCSTESPAQSWNAICVGAYTEKLLPNANTLANKFELSPYSRTSSSWDNSWPLKPEVVFEGGNRILLENGETAGHDDLEVLTTARFALDHNFTTIWATSSATAFASNFLAKLRNVYPNAWVETLRGLMIHSANWKDEMIHQFEIDTTKKGDIQKLLKIVGYGIPNLEKAIECKSNYLTFISEQIIKPYKLDGGDLKTNEIHYYEFPWPKDILENLGAADVTLRVTLSYYIEPNPGDKGYNTKYSYQSCALKFHLNKPNELLDSFQVRTNKISQDNLKEELGKATLDENDYSKGTLSERWFYGPKNIFKGSIHSDFWKGSAADIASCNILAVYPLASGWWKQLKKQNKGDSQLRYSLIVSIETPENTADIYTPIATRVAVENLIVI
ncbi:MAG TPA: S8 family peptidase [Lutibacter sp.]